MAEDNLKAFLAENAIKPAEAAYAASARFWMRTGSRLNGSCG